MAYAKVTIAMAHEVGLTPKQLVNFPNGVKQGIRLLTKKPIRRCSRTELMDAIRRLGSIGRFHTVRLHIRRLRAAARLDG